MRGVLNGFPCSWCFLLTSPFGITTLPFLANLHRLRGVRPVCLAVLDSHSTAIAIWIVCLGNCFLVASSLVSIPFQLVVPHTLLSDFVPVRPCVPLFLRRPAGRHRDYGLTAMLHVEEAKLSRDHALFCICCHCFIVDRFKHDATALAPLLFFRVNSLPFHFLFLRSASLTVCLTNVPHNLSVLTAYIVAQLSCISFSYVSQEHWPSLSQACCSPRLFKRRGLNMI